MEMKHTLRGRGGVSQGFLVGVRVREAAYRKPKPKTADRMSFCRRGSLMVQTTGMGSRKMRKSVTALCPFYVSVRPTPPPVSWAVDLPMCSPVLDHHTLCGWQYFLSRVKSQYEFSGMQAVNVTSAM